MEVFEKLRSWFSSTLARKLVDFSLSFLGVVGICKFCGIADNWQVFPFNSFLFLVFLVLLYIAYSRRKKLDKGAEILTIVMTILLSCILVIGKQLDLLSRINWSFGTLLMIACLGCVIYVAMEYVVSFCTSFCLSGDLELSRKQKWIIFAIIFVSNFLIYLALFPGVFGWDSNMQAWQFLNNRLNTHYSVLLSAVFGSILWLGNAIFGSYAAGLAIAMFLQMTFMSYVYAKVVYFAVENSRSKAVLLGSVAFFTLTLIMGIATVYSTQDIIFGGAFALIFMELYQVNKNPEHWSKKLNIIKFVLLGFVLCATRNNGLYVLCVVFMAAIFINVKRKRNLLVIAIPIVIGLVYTGPVFSLLHIPNLDSAKEMLGVPSQQLARVYVFSEGALTADEKAEIEEYYNKEEFVKYHIFTAKADKTKGALDDQKVKENWFKYISLWLRVGLKNPKAYIEAFLLNSIGTWYPNKEYNDPRSDIPYIDFAMSRLWSEYEGQYAYMRIDRHSLLPGYERILSRLFYENQWQSVPLLSNLVSTGTYFLLCVFLCGMTIYKKRKHYILPLALVLGNYLILLLAPVSIFRYCYPMIIVAPIMMIMLFEVKNRKTVKVAKTSKVLKKGSHGTSKK